MPPTKQPYLSAAFRGKQLSQDPSAAGLDAVSKSVLKELLEDNIDTTLIRREIEELRDAHTFLPVTFRQRLLHALHSLPVQISLIVLIILDVCIVLAAIIVDIFINAETLHDSQQVGNDFLQYLVLINNTGGCVTLHSSVVAELASVHGAHKAIADVLSKKSTVLVTGVLNHHRRKRSSESDFPEGSTGYTLEQVAHVLHYIAIAILAILVLEVLLKIGAHGKHILQHKIGIVDGLVNTASLIIDILITGSSTVGGIGKVIVVLTLVWQVFRILNAIVITSQARAELRIRLLKKAKAMHEGKVDEMRKQVIWAKSEIGRLCHIAAFYGVPRYELKTPVLSTENDEDVAKGGIQASLFQLLRFNNAILRSSSTQQHDEVEAVAQSVAVAAQWRASLPDLRAALENEEQALADAGQARHFGGSPAFGDITSRLPSAADDSSAIADASGISASADCAERGGDAHEMGDSQPQQCETTFAQPRRSWPRALNKRRMPCRSGTVLQLFNAGVPHALTSCKKDKEPAATASTVHVDGLMPATEGHPPGCGSIQSTATAASVATDAVSDTMKNRGAHAAVLQLPRDAPACKLVDNAAVATRLEPLSTIEAAAEALGVEAALSA